ncbi:hypothetical protein REG_1873 [Candidatus Regiella insecticola LSR1]|uniref:dihydroneopterin aldolase n=1 Tax=Candidatus Regiella insecticola LSR1 TaxID=663321 RepID=E0WUW7_9ENTR|nr:hypothetical protein REG_1873 [Candidatus Regiella insecticola LSR1]
MDIIFIEQLSVITTIGVYDWEQKTQQKLLLDVEIGCEKGKAAKTDEVKDCLNYADISKAIIEHIKKKSLRPDRTSRRKCSSTFTKKICYTLGAG